MLCTPRVASIQEGNLSLWELPAPAWRGRLDVQHLLLHTAVKSGLRSSRIRVEVCLPSDPTLGALGRYAQGTSSCPSGICWSRWGAAGRSSTRGSRQGTVQGPRVVFTLGDGLFFWQLDIVIPRGWSSSRGGSGVGQCPSLFCVFWQVALDRSLKCHLLDSDDQTNVLEWCQLCVHRAFQQSLPIPTPLPVPSPRSRIPP